MRTGRVVILGGGIAALYAALRLAPHPVLVVSPEPLGQGASSAWAQGGVAAAMAAPDSAAAHAADTVAAGAGLVDPAVAARVCAEAPAHVAALTGFGTPFDRDAAGRYLLSREAAHSLARVVRVGGDGSGRAIMAALIAAVRDTPSIRVAERMTAEALLTDAAGAVTGVTLTATDGRHGALALHCPAVLMAAGGAAGLYASTTNPARIRGQALGMAARAGAVIADAEFVQFHPTAIAGQEDPCPLATEALRGDGAWLVNAEGRRFMTALHPAAELAPRDVVARGVFAETMAGRAPALDCRMLGPEMAEHFPVVHAACLRAGIDPSRQPVPVVAAAHYHMGGIAVDAQGRSALPGLWAAGEAAATGLHGANRLASNGLLEALVYGAAAAADIATTLPDTPPDTLPETLAADDLPADLLRALPQGRSGADPARVAALRALMSREVGVIRTASGLRRALAGITALAAADASPAFANMAAAALVMTAAALAREGSRGAQCRADFPAPGPATRSRLTLAQAQAIAAAAAATPVARPPQGSPA